MLNEKEMKALAAQTFKDHPAAEKVIVFPDGNCFLGDAANFAKLHARDSKLEGLTVEKDGQSGPQTPKGGLSPEIEAAKKAMLADAGKIAEAAIGKAEKAIETAKKPKAEKGGPQTPKGGLKTGPKTTETETPEPAQ